MKEKNKKRGFTIVELIIVLAILAIIAAIAIPNLVDLRNNAANKADVQSANVIKRTVTMYVTDGSIPSSAYSGTLTFTIDSAGKTSLTEAQGKTAVESGLKEVKPLQGRVFSAVSTGEATFGENKAAKFIVTIDSQGNISVGTASEESDSAGE